MTRTTRKSPTKRMCTKTRFLTDNGHRSGLEDKVADQLARKGQPVCYELYKIKYDPPAKTRTYTPDFVLPNAIIIETKGRFVTADRQKHKFIKAQYPNLVIRFVFSNPNQRISKKSQTTYAMWCDQYGFEYAAKLIPDAWFKESLTPLQVEATKTVLGWTPPKRK